MSNFDIEITSVPDRERLVSEIWYDNNLVCELNKENDNIQVQLFAVPVMIDYSGFIKALEIAKNRLLNDS